jgi:hypothetical protein
MQGLKNEDWCHKAGFAPSARELEQRIHSPVSTVLISETSYNRDEIALEKFTKVRHS